MNPHESAEYAALSAALSFETAERKRAEEALRAANQRLEALIDRSPLAICVCDAAGRVTLWNPAAELMFGWSEAEALGGYLPHVSEANRADADSLRQLVLGGQSITQLEKVRHRRDGSEIVVSLSNAPLYNAEGKATEVLIIAADVSARKRAQDEQRRATEWLRAIIQVSPLAIYACDLDGNVTLWNSAAERTFGWSAQEVKGRGIPFVPEDKRDEFRGLQARIFNGDSLRDIEVRRRRKDGSAIDISASAAPIYDASGKPVGSMSIAIDITERKTTEKRLRDQLRFSRQLIEAMANPVYVKDTQGRYVGLNRAWEQFFGNSRSAWLGKTVYELLPKELADLHHAKDQQLLRSGGTQVYECTLPAADGKLHNAICQKSGFTDDDGRVAGVIGVITDISESKRAEAQLVAAKERLKLALTSSNLSLWDLDLRSGQIYLSEEWSALLGEEPRETFTTLEQLLTIVHPSEVDGLRRHFAEVIKGAASEYRVEHRVCTATTEWKWILSHGKVVERDAQARALRMSGTNADITERKIAEQALRANEEKFRLITENVSDLIALIDAEGRRLYNSPSYASLFGTEGLPALGSNSFDEIHPEDREQVWQVFQETLTTGAGQHARFRFLLRDGTIRYLESQGNVIRDDAGAVSKVVIVSRDVTERLNTEERMRFLAHHDMLTALPNRTLLQDRVRQELIRAQASGKRVAVLFIDLDDFKNVNDSLGHAIGDELLRQAAQRLTHALRSEDMVARQGGDEFIVLVTNLDGRDFLPLIARKILDSLSEPFAIHNNDIHLTASVGISVYPEDGGDSEPLLKNADTAMYYAKAQGKNGFQFFSPEMQAVIRQRLSLERALRAAVERDELVLHYQSQVSLETGAIVGLESLVRWRHPELGLLGPAQFIPYAEENGLIIAIGKWVLREACRQAKRWEQAGYPALRVAVNVSGRQLRHHDFLNSVAEALRETGLDPLRLELEVTESVIMQHVDQTLVTLAELRRLGIKLSIDDFGTGYSSLSYLKRFEIDSLKIDRSFVRDIVTDRNDAAIVRAILALANSLGIQVTAEGVETEEQLALLREQGCAQAQGYLLGKPLPAAELERLLVRSAFAPRHRY